MEKAIKFLGVCILAGCLMISAVVFYANYASLKQSRYYFSREASGTPMVFDNMTGKYYYASTISSSSRTFYEIDPINKIANKDTRPNP